MANFLGVTKDQDSNFMFVMRDYECGDLHSYLDEAQGMLCWRDIVEMLWEISGGLYNIHELELVHGNLRGGNVLVENGTDSIDTRISDVGLHGSANKKSSNEIY